MSKIEKIKKLRIDTTPEHKLLKEIFDEGIKSGILIKENIDKAKKYMPYSEEDVDMISTFVISSVKKIDEMTDAAVEKFKEENPDAEEVDKMMMDAKQHGVRVATMTMLQELSVLDHIIHSQGDYTGKEIKLEDLPEEIQTEIKKAIEEQEKEEKQKQE